jgi:hypothetical protein
VLYLEMLHYVSRRGILALRNLKSLEEFLFSNDILNQNEVVLVKRHCFELLPNLHHLNEIPCSISLFNIDGPCTLQLRRLRLGNVNNISEQVSLPELQRLYLGNLEMSPLFAGRLPKLSELCLDRTDVHTLLLVLGHVGRQLQMLDVQIRDGGVHLQLDRVLENCPNLYKLKVNSTKFDVVRVSQLQPDTLQQLQTLHLELCYSEVVGHLQSGLLLQVLRLAPDLRSINLSGYMLLDEDLREWAQLAEQGTCMQHLRQIQFDGPCTPTEKRLLKEAVASCSINCPQLQIATDGCWGTETFLVS